MCLSISQIGPYVVTGSMVQVQQRPRRQIGYLQEERQERGRLAQEELLLEVVRREAAGLVRRPPRVGPPRVERPAFGEEDEAVEELE